jgi:hypothetical protein
VKARTLLTTLAGALTLLVAALTLVPTPAQAATPAERARAIAAALSKDPLYVDAAYRTGLPENLRDDVRKKAQALGYPVYTVVLPLTPSDEFQGQESTALTLIIDALHKPGLYVVVDGGGRFPWYEAHDLPQVTDEKLDASRDRALDDTGYDAGQTEVLARMYELLAQPGIPAPNPKPGTPARSRTSDDGGHGWIVAGSIIGGLVVLVGLGLVIGRLRGPGSGRGKTFRIPPHVAATVAAERRRRLTRETTAELTTLGSELAALPTTSGPGLVHQQAALDDHAAASKVLDSSPDLVDLVGAMVLLDKARREYDAAVAAAAGRRTDAVPDLCAFNPLHGRASGRPTKVESDGTTLMLPLCVECRQALRKGRAPGSLPGQDGPYWYEDTLWARTFFGTTGENLAEAVSRGELRR